MVLALFSVVDFHNVNVPYPRHLKARRPVTARRVMVGACCAYFKNRIAEYRAMARIIVTGSGMAVLLYECMCPCF